MGNDLQTPRTGGLGVKEVLAWNKTSMVKWLFECGKLGAMLQVEI